MKTEMMTRALTHFTSLASLFVAVACGGNSTGPTSGETQNAVGSANTACAADTEDEAADKVTCSIDTECDADEVCLNATCTGMDEAAEGACADQEDENGDDKDEDDKDEDDKDEDDKDEDGADKDEDDKDEDEDGADKVNCSTDLDCDADEVCTNGKCD